MHKAGRSGYVGESDFETDVEGGKNNRFQTAESADFLCSIIMNNPAEVWWTAGMIVVDQRALVLCDVIAVLWLKLDFCPVGALFYTDCTRII